MSDFAALAYLEWRQLVNKVKQLAANPMRAVLWVLVGGYLLFMLGLRSFDRAHIYGSAFGLHDPWATVVSFALLTGFGLSLLPAALGSVRTFSTLTDARFLTGSAMRERNVVIWLQLRNSTWLIGRFAFAIVFYAVIFRSFGSAISIVSASVAYLTVVTCAGIPVLKLRVRAGAKTAIAFACVVIAAGFIPFVATLVGIFEPAAATLTNAIVSLGVGTLVSSALANNGTPIVALFGFSAVLIVAAAVGANDLYPELYRGTSAFITARSRIASRRGRRSDASGTPTRNVFASLGASPGMHGAWAMVWRQRAIASRSGNRLWLLRSVGFASALLVGGAMGALASSFSDPSFATAIAITFTILALMIVSMFSTNSLADDLGKPLWWLSASTLRDRLYVWLFLRSRFLGFWMATALGVFALWLRHPALFLPAVAFGFFLAAFCNAIGLITYSLFPSRIDQRGPGTALRPVLLGFLFLPIMAAALIASLALHSRAAVGTISFLTGCAEIALLVECAALRLRYSGATAQRAEDS